MLELVRYGKPFVLDMMEVDMFDACRMKFDEVQKGLMDAIMDKSILTEPVLVPMMFDKAKPDVKIVNFLYKPGFGVC